MTTQKADNEPVLKPCPFCGGKAMWGEGEQKTKYGNEQVYCTDCWAITAPEGSKSEASENWNSRASVDSAAPVVDEMWEALKAECCKNPAEAKLAVFVSEHKFKKALAPFAAAPPAIPQPDQVARAAKEIASRSSHMPPAAPLSRMKAAFALDCIEIAAIISKHLRAVPVAHDNTGWTPEEFARLFPELSDEQRQKILDESAASASPAPLQEEAQDKQQGR